MEAPDTDIRFMALNDLVMSLQKGILQQNEISSDVWFIFPSNLMLLAHQCCFETVKG